MHVPLRLPRRVLASAGVAGLALVAGGVLMAQASLTISDVSAPRGLTTTDAGVLVADQGNGRILLIDNSGDVSVIADGLPTTIFDSPEGMLNAGVTAAIEVDGVYYFTVGEGNPGDAGFQAVYSVVPGEEPVMIADLGAYERANNTDGGVDEVGDPDTASNPYDLVSDGNGGLYVSDSGANAILHVTAGGDISPFAVLPPVSNPLFPNLGGPTTQAVPTGLVIGPDGALYVSTLTGFPFNPGSSKVYRMKDLSGNGNAMDLGETKVYAEGLNPSTNLAFDTDGSLLVAEFSTDFLNNAPGHIVRVVGGEIGETVAAPLVSPTGLTVDNNGEILVSMEFLNVVADAKSAAAIVASSGPPPAEEPGTPSGPVTPPSTGDAGLAASHGSNAAVVLGLAVLLALAAPLGAAAVSRKR